MGVVVEVLVVVAGAVEEDLIWLDVGLHLPWDFVLVLMLVVLTVVVAVVVAELLVDVVDVVGATHLPFKAVP
jgi:hypothetical protein